jgi:hypothetical protein
MGLNLSFQLNYVTCSREEGIEAELSDKDTCALHAKDDVEGVRLQKLTNNVGSLEDGSWQLVLEGVRV